MGTRPPLTLPRDAGTDSGLRQGAGEPRVLRSPGSAAAGEGLRGGAVNRTVAPEKGRSLDDFSPNVLASLPFVTCLPHSSLEG